MKWYETLQANTDRRLICLNVRTGEQVDADIENPPEGTVLLDAQTQNAMLTVDDHLEPHYREVFRSLNPARAGLLAWKCF